MPAAPAIVDQLIRIREFEEKLVAAFQGADQRCIASASFSNRRTESMDGQTGSRAGSLLPVRRRVRLQVGAGPLRRMP